MSNFERDMANTMLDAADARIASLEADKADLLRVLSIADEKIRSGEDARGQYIRENAALEARCLFLEERLRDINEYNECGPKNKDIDRVLDAAFPPETRLDPDDAPINLDGFDKPGAVFKIGGKVVSRDEGLEAFRKRFALETKVRQCTCHPDDRPPFCQHRYAASECQDAYRAYQANRGGVK